MQTQCEEIGNLVRFTRNHDGDVKLSWSEHPNGMDAQPLLKTKGKQIEVKKPLLSKRIYYILTTANEKEICAPRRVELEGSFNMRDLGGYVGKDGKRVRWGCLYRSDDLSQLTLADMPIVESLGLHTIVDFRNDGERIKRPNKQLSGVTTFHLDPNAETAALASGSLASDKDKVAALVEIAKQPNGETYFNNKLSEMKHQMIELAEDPYCIQQYKKLLHLLLEESRAPLLEHCRGGKDRTGFATALILFALGVSKEDVLEDYMLTRTYMRKRNEKRMAEYAQFTDNEMVLKYLYSLMDTKQEYMEAAYATMEKIAGCIEQYLVNVMDFDKSKQEKLQTYFLSE